MATIVRIGKNGEITTGRMTRSEELRLYGTYTPKPPGYYLEKRRELQRRVQAELLPSGRLPEDDQ